MKCSLHEILDYETLDKIVDRVGNADPLYEDFRETLRGKTRLIADWVVFHPEVGDVVNVGDKQLIVMLRVIDIPKPKTRWYQSTTSGEVKVYAFNFLDS